MPRLSLPLSMLLLVLCLSAYNDNGARIMTSVMTYNIHNELSPEQPRSWDERRAMVLQVIKSRTPDMLGMQGATLGQANWIDDNLDGYGLFAPIEGNLKVGLDLCPILYSELEFDALDQGSFLIGEAILQRDEVEDNALFLNWVKLEHKSSKKQLWLINTRLDEYELSNLEDPVADRIKDVISELVGDETFILLGGLNATPESATVAELSTWAKDSYESSLVSITNQEATSFGWERQSEGQRLDYIFLSQDIPANSYEVVDISLDNQYPSDHLPVYCKLRVD